MTGPLVHSSVEAELGLMPMTPAEGNRLKQREDRKPASQRAGSFDSSLLLPGNRVWTTEHHFKGWFTSGTLILNWTLPCFILQLSHSFSQWGGPHLPPMGHLRVCSRISPISQFLHCLDNCNRFSSKGKINWQSFAQPCKSSLLSPKIHSYWKKNPAPTPSLGGLL